MSDLITLIFALIVDLFRSRAALEAEVIALRQQILVLRRGRPARLPFLVTDRLVLGWHAPAITRADKFFHIERNHERRFCLSIRSTAALDMAVWTGAVLAGFEAVPL